MIMTYHNSVPGCVNYHELLPRKGVVIRGGASLATVGKPTWSYAGAASATVWTPLGSLRIGTHPAACPPATFTTTWSLKQKETHEAKLLYCLVNQWVSRMPMKCHSPTKYLDTSSIFIPSVTPRLSQSCPRRRINACTAAENIHSKHLDHLTRQREATLSCTHPLSRSSPAEVSLRAERSMPRLRSMSKRSDWRLSRHLNLYSEYIWWICIYIYIYSHVYIYIYTY